MNTRKSPRATKAQEKVERNPIPIIKVLRAVAIDWAKRAE
jgi:hypothetical protein